MRTSFDRLWESAGWAFTLVIRKSQEMDHPCSGSAPYSTASHAGSGRRCRSCRSASSHQPSCRRNRSPSTTPGLATNWASSFSLPLRAKTASWIGRSARTGGKPVPVMLDSLSACFAHTWAGNAGPLAPVCCHAGSGWPRRQARWRSPVCKDARVFMQSCSRGTTPTETANGPIRDGHQNLGIPNHPPRLDEIGESTTGLTERKEALFDVLLSRVHT